MCSELSFVVGLMSESLMRALGFLLCACVRYSCKLSFYCSCVLTIIRLDTPEYTEPRETPNMAMSVPKLIEEGGEPGRLLTGHLFADLLSVLNGWPSGPSKRPIINPKSTYTKATFSKSIPGSTVRTARGYY